MMTISLRSKSSIYDHYAIPESARGTIHGFTAQAVTSIYQGTLRQQATSLGYPDHAVTLTDQASLASIDAFAAERADKIISGTNQRLSNALSKLPENLTDAELHAGLAQWRADTKAYNQDTMLPYTKNWAKGSAIHDFARNNQDSINQLWVVEPSETDQTDECEEAISLGEVQTSWMLQYEFPNHQGCPHLWTVTSTLTPQDELPALPDLWLGGEAGMAFDLSSDENNSQWAKGLSDDQLTAQLKVEATSTVFDDSAMNALLSEAAQRGKLARFIPDASGLTVKLADPTPSELDAAKDVTALQSGTAVLDLLDTAGQALQGKQYGEAWIYLSDASFYHLAAAKDGWKIASDGTVQKLTGTKAPKKATPKPPSTATPQTVPGPQAVPHGAASPAISKENIKDALNLVKASRDVQAILPELRLIAEHDRFINNIGGLSTGLHKVPKILQNKTDAQLGQAFKVYKLAIESPLSTQDEIFKAQQNISKVMLVARSRGFTLDALGSRLEFGETPPAKATAPVTAQVAGGPVNLTQLELPTNKAIAPTNTLGKITYGKKYSQAEIDAAYPLPSPPLATASEIAGVKRAWTNWPTEAHFVAMELEFGVKIEDWQRPKVDKWINAQIKASPEQYAKTIDLYRRALKQDYINDQRAMMHDGIESITLARGIHFDATDTPAEWWGVKTGDVGAFHAQPLNSYTISRSVANSHLFGAKGEYGTAGYVMFSDVPREWIQSRDNWGNSNEREIVVMGGQHRLNVGVDNVGGSQPHGTPKKEEPPAAPLQAPGKILTPDEKIIATFEATQTATQAFKAIQSFALEQGKIIDPTGNVVGAAKITPEIKALTDEGLGQMVKDWSGQLTAKPHDYFAAHAIGQALLEADSRGLSISKDGTVTKAPETNEQLAKKFGQVSTVEEAKDYALMLAEKGKYLGKDKAVYDLASVPDFIKEKSDADLIAYVAQQHTFLATYNLSAENMSRLGRALIEAMNRGLTINGDGTLLPKGTAPTIEKPKPVAPVSTAALSPTELLWKAYHDATDPQTAYAALQQLAAHDVYLNKHGEVTPADQMPDSYHLMSNADLIEIVKSYADVAHTGDTAGFHLSQALLEAKTRGLTINYDGTTPNAAPTSLTEKILSGLSHLHTGKDAIDFTLELAADGKFIDPSGTETLSMGSDGAMKFNGHTDKELLAFLESQRVDLLTNGVNTQVISYLGQALVEAIDRGLQTDLYKPVEAKAEPTETKQPAAELPLTDLQLNAKIKAATDVAEILPELRQLAAHGKFINTAGGNSTGIHKVSGSLVKLTDAQLADRFLTYKHSIEDGFSTQAEMFTAQRLISQVMLVAHDRGFTFEQSGTITKLSGLTGAPKPSPAAAPESAGPISSMEQVKTPQDAKDLALDLAEQGQGLSEDGHPVAAAYDDAIASMSPEILSAYIDQIHVEIESDHQSGNPPSAIFIGELAKALGFAVEKGLTINPNGTLDLGKVISYQEIKTLDEAKSWALTLAKQGKYLGFDGDELPVDTAPGILTQKTDAELAEYVAAQIKQFGSEGPQLDILSRLSKGLALAIDRGIPINPDGTLNLHTAAPAGPITELAQVKAATDGKAYAAYLANKGTFLDPDGNEAAWDVVPGIYLSQKTDTELLAYIEQKHELIDKYGPTNLEISNLSEALSEAQSRGMTINTDGTATPVAGSSLEIKPPPPAEIDHAELAEPAPPVPLEPAPAPELPPLPPYVPTVLPSGAILPKPQAPTLEDQHLREGTFSGYKNLGGGANDVYQTTLTNPDGTVHQVVVKDNPNHTHHMRGDINKGGDFDREISAVVLNKALGDLVFMPTTIRRDTEKFGDTLVMDMIPNSSQIGHKSGPAAEENALAVYDALSGNLDRHGGNALLYTAADGTTHLASIDHGLSFYANTWSGKSNTATMFMDRHGGDAIPQAIRENLVSLNEHWLTVSADLAQTGLRQTDLDALHIRLAWMIDHGTIPKTFDQILTSTYKIDPSTHLVLKDGQPWSGQKPAEPTPAAPAKEPAAAKTTGYGPTLPPLELNAQIKASNSIAAVLPQMRQLAGYGKFINSIGGNSTGVHKVSASILKMSDSDLSKAFLGHKGTIESPLSSFESRFASQRNISQIMLAAADRGFTFELDGSRTKLSDLTPAKQIAAPPENVPGVILLPDKVLEDKTPRVSPTPSQMKSLDDAGLLDLYHTLKNAVTPDPASVNALMDQIASRDLVIADGTLAAASSSVWTGMDPADLARAAQHTLVGLAQDPASLPPGALAEYLQALSEIHAAAAAQGIHLSDDGRFLTDEQVGNKTPANAFNAPLEVTPPEKLETPAHPYLPEDPAVHTFLADTAPSLLHGLIDSGTAAVAKLAQPGAHPKWNEKIQGEAADAELLKTDLAARGKALGISITYESKSTLAAHGAAGARGYVTPGTTVIHVDETLNPQLQATVIAHEMGHLLDQVFATEESKARWATLSSPDSYAHNEIIAESFSNLISKLYNLDSDSHAVGYTAQYAHGSLDGAAALHQERDRVLQLLDHFLSTDTATAPLKPTGEERLVAQIAPEVKNLDEAALADRFLAERTSTAYDPVAVNDTITAALQRGLMFKTDDGSLVPAKEPALLHSESTNIELSQLVVSLHTEIEQAITGSDQQQVNLLLRRLGNILWEGQQRGVELEADGNIRDLEPLPPPPSTAAATDPVWQHATTDTLQSGTLSQIANLGGGVHTTLTATLVQADGAALPVFIKPQSGLDTRVLRRGIDPASDLPREVGAGIINDALGSLVEMPVVVQRDIRPYGPSVVEEFVPDSRILGSQLPEKVAGHAGAVFDAVIGNLDRKPDNILLRTDSSGDDHLVMVDHGMAFPLGAETRTRDEYNSSLLQQFGGTALTIPERDALQRLIDHFYPTIFQALRLAGIRKEEADAVAQRTAWMITHNQVPSDFAAFAEE